MHVANTTNSHTFELLCIHDRHTKMNVIIIPARGGSKRIPRKNIRLFAGKPIISHSIHAAISAGIADRVIVSTDDQEIAEIARNHGAETPFFRPAELSDDHAGTLEVIQHTIAALEAGGCTPQNVCCLYATAPFVTPELLRDGLARLKSSGHSYAFTVTDFGFPIQRALRITDQGEIEPLHPEYRFTRSQDLEPCYQDAGQFYWGKADAWKQGELIYSTKSVPIVLKRHLVQDIDTKEDWQRAEWLYSAWKNQSGELA